jgi:hypothetical protein
MCCAELSWRLTLDDEALAAGAGAEVEVQAALKTLLDEVGIGRHLQQQERCRRGLKSRP